MNATVRARERARSDRLQPVVSLVQRDIARPNLRRNFAPRSPTRVGLALALALAAACKADGEGGTFDFGQSTTGTSGPPTTSAGSSGSEGSGSVGSSSSGSDDTATTSASESSSSGGESSSGGLVTDYCTGLDVLVVIDDSDTMLEEQGKLTAALSPFFAQLDQLLPGIMGSIRVGVITTDAPEFVVANPSMACTPYASAATWMSYGPTLSTELACATAVGTMGDPDERPMQMAIEALGPTMLQLGGPNEAFLREDAPLVLIILTDEEDDLEAVTQWGSEGDPSDWITALAATQDGHVQNVVPIALVGVAEPNDCPFPWDGVTGAEIAPRLAEFVDGFPHGALGDICAADYSTFLMAAATEVVDACNAHVPE